MAIDWFIVGVIVAVIALIAFVYRYHTRGATEIAPSSFVTEALTGLEAPKSVDPEDDPLGQLSPLIATFQFQFPERERYADIKKQNGDSKITEKALFDRAVACVGKITHVQRYYPHLQQAKQGNILPDEVWNMIQMKLKLVDDEYQDIRKEADGMVPNGGNAIFAQAKAFFEQELLPRLIANQQRMAQQAQAQAQAQAQGGAAAGTSGTAQPLAQPQQIPNVIPTPEQITAATSGTPTKSAPSPADIPKQAQLKNKLEQQMAEKKAAEQVKKPEDAQSQAQKQAAADKAYKELLRAESQGGKKSKKSKKDE